MDRPHSYSSLSTLAACQEKFRLAYIERLESPTVNLPMLAGSAIDAALNYLYVTEWDEAGALDALRASWGETRPPIGSKHPWLTLPFLEERIRLYMREREESPTILEEGEIVAAFSGDLHRFDWIGPEGGVVTVRGIPDFVVRAEGKIWVCDLKATTQWVNDYWFLQFKVGNQLRMYAAMYQNLEGEEVAGGLINAVYMGEKALDDAAAWKRRASAPSQLKRIDFTQEQIDETWKWVRGLEAVEAACEASGIWPRNEKACGMYSGCEFLQLCTAPSEGMRKALMQTRYVRREER